MKIYRMHQLAESAPDGAYCLGSDNVKTASAYLTYSKLKPRETGRRFATADGCEEIIYVVKGSIRVSSGKYKPFSVAAGEAFSPSGPLLLDNSGDTEAVFITAGAKALAAAAADVAAPPLAADTAPTGGRPAPQAPHADEAAPEADADEFEISR